MANVLRRALDRCEALLEEAHDEASLVGAYQSIALSFIPVAIAEPDVVLLYLQESRAPAAGARAPLRALADEIRERAVELTELAVDQGLLRVPDPQVSGLAVVGAVEQLAWSMLCGDLEAPPDQVAGTLISLVLSGIKG